MKLQPFHASGSLWIPEMISDAGDRAANRYTEFFVANIRNKGTREAYGHAAKEFFRWCSGHGIPLESVSPIVVATYIEQIGKRLSPPTVKLHLAAIRMLFDYLTTGHIVEFNPAASVRGPRHVVHKGKTPVLQASEARQLLDSIDINTIIGLRDRALIGVMAFSFARISAALSMNVEDFFVQRQRRWFRLYEKGGKQHEVPAHHKAEEYLHEYLLAAGALREPKLAIFQSINAGGRLTGKRLSRSDALRIVKRRAKQSGIGTEISCHTFRATGITTFLQNGGTLEKAMLIAAHSSARTTKLYDRTSDELSLEEMERVRI